MKSMCVVALLLGTARAEPPYRLWWSLPLDDAAAIEVDEADLGASEFASRWQLVMALGRCDKAKKKRAKEGSPVRELRIDSLDGDGKVRTSRRCLLSHEEWEAKLGARMVERLDDELDAHESFLRPRKRPGMPAGSGGD
jgi:hypothetical protein